VSAHSPTLAAQLLFCLKILENHRFGARVERVGLIWLKRRHFIATAIYALLPLRSLFGERSRLVVISEWGALKGDSNEVIRTPIVRSSRAAHLRINSCVCSNLTQIDWVNQQ
jgi:hypothetical protein